MKQAITVVLLCLFVSSVSTQDLEFFQSLTKSDFGKTILQTIQIELKQSDLSDGTAQILDFVQSLRSEVLQDQEDATKVINKRKGECDAIFSEIDEYIARNEAKRIEDERQQPLLQESVQDKVEQANDKTAEEQRNLDRIAVLTQDRIATRQAYEERRDELTGQVAALKEAKEIIAQLKGDSFLQVATTSLVEELQVHHAEFTRNYPKQKGFSSLIKMLLQTLTTTTSKADKKTVEKLLGVIDALTKVLFKVSEEELAADDQREAAFVQAKTRLETLNQFIAQEVAAIKALVEVGNQKLLELQNDINSRQQSVSNKNQERNHWTKTCNDDQRGYDQLKTIRDEQIQIVNEVIRVFTGKVPEDAKKKICQIQITA